MKFKPSIRIGKILFELGMVVGARWAGLSISGYAKRLGFSKQNHLMCQREGSKQDNIIMLAAVLWMKTDGRGQKRMAGLL